jgi:WD40 repeat protein
MLALAKLAEADKVCASEKASSADLEKTIATNLANDAPSKGTEATMRAKMHQAYDAERAKDWAKAKTLYLDAWAEHHPSPRALENAGRMAALAEDAAESRRLRDRALAEAEATEHGVAQVAARGALARGSARLAGTTLTLAFDGKVIARDTATGELRLLLDVKAKNMTLSPWGTLASASTVSYGAGMVSVYDVLTGTLVFRAMNVVERLVSPRDTRVLVRDDDVPNDTNVHVRLYDVATGEIKARPSGKWSGLLGFGSDDSHVLLTADDGKGTNIEELDLDKGTIGSMRLAGQYPTAVAVSLDGHALAYLDQWGSDASALRIYDLTTHKEITQWTSKFHSVTSLALSPDAKTVATGSSSSMRLWDVGQKKQLWKREGERSTGAEDVAFSDDSKTMVVGGWGAPIAWDVATGTDKLLTADATPKNILHVVKTPTQAGGGVALVLEDEVRLVPASGDSRTVCKGLPQPSWANPPVIGPTSIAFSASGKSLACAMWDGWVHVLDTSTWAETFVIKHGAASPIDRPVDLVFSADDATLTDVSNVGFVVYDAKTGKETSRVAFRHGTSGFAPRHARFDDGSVAVRAWNGTAAIFAADGTWQRDVKLVAATPATALDAFASSGKSYAVAVGKTLHVVDLATDDDKTTELPSTVKGVALSSDGKTVLVAESDGAITTVTDGTATPLGRAKGIRVAFAGKSILVWTDKSVIDAYASTSDTTPVTLDIDANGVVARDATGAFETRGKPEVVCVVGATHLSRITCDDRARDGLVAKWMSLL